MLKRCSRISIICRKKNLKFSGKLRLILCYREYDLEKILRQSGDEEKKIGS